MTVQNDFNALINAIIDNLEEMGVMNVSFESETGIMGLIDRILEIETRSSIEVPTVIDCVMTLPEPNTTITVGDSYTCSGALRGSYNNFSFKIGGATIYAYNHDDLLGQAVTNSDGNFTINGMYHKATSSVSYSLRFLATDIFLSSTLTGSATRPVNKKSITLSQSINDTWISTPDEYSINIGSQYQDAPITLMIDSQRYDMEYVDENGVVTFDISNLTGVNECQLVVETNDVFSNAQSNTFNISIGVNIYINPELQITSDKDILSYADNENATLTAKIKSDATEISSVNIPLTYREDPVLTATKSGITITEQNNLYLCESVNTDGYIVFDMDAEQTETSFTISNVTANSVDSDAKCTLVQYYHGEGTVTYSWELLDTNNFGNGDYIIRIKDGNIDIYKDGIHVANQSLSEGYKLGFGIYGYSFDISDINIERIINNGLNTGVYASRGVGDVAITAKYGTLVSETYVVEDCVKYDTTVYLTGTDTNTVPYNVDLPSHFEIDYEYLITQSSTYANSSLLWIGESTSKAVLIGRVSGTSSNYQTWVRTSADGSGDIKHTGDAISFQSGYQSMKVTYDGTSLVFNKGITVTNLNGVSLDKLVQITGFHAQQTVNWGQIKNIKVKPLHSVSLTSDKSVLSYADNDTCTLTATHTAGTGKLVQLYDASDDSLIGTMVDNEDGTYSYTYTSQGVGDIGFYAKSGNLVSKIYEITDAKYYNDGSTVNGLTSQTNVSTTSDGEWITITTSTSGEKYVLAPVNVSSSDNWEMSLKIKVTNSQNCAFNLLNENSFSLFNNVYMNISGNTTFYFRLDGGNAQQVSRTFQDNDKITIRRQNGSWIILHNDEQVYTKSYSWSGTKTIGWYTNQNRTQIMKEIIIKQL